MTIMAVVVVTDVVVMTAAVVVDAGADSGGSGGGSIGVIHHGVTICGVTPYRQPFRPPFELFPFILSKTGLQM